jgi:hypothetical protein
MRFLPCPLIQSAADGAFAMRTILQQSLVFQCSIVSHRSATSKRKWLPSSMEEAYRVQAGSRNDVKSSRCSQEPAASAPGLR